MKPATAPSALKIQSLLGADFTVLEFDASTRTAADAAAAIGCSVAQIAKSVMFSTAEHETPVLVVTSGVNRVDEKRVATLIGHKLKRADADFVRAATGFAIGGVPPIGHAVAPITLIDEDLFQFTTIWAAAGTPNAVFQLAPATLEHLTRGRRAVVALPTFGYNSQKNKQQETPMFIQNKAAHDNKACTKHGTRFVTITYQ